MTSVYEGAIGTNSESVSLEISRNRLRFFAKATGQHDPVYTDLEAARAAGHPDLPVPPTFLMGVELESSDPFLWLAELGIDLRTVLHGSQEFTYHRLVYAGETITAHTELRDTYEKRGGELTFLVRTTAFRDATGELVAEASSTTIVRRLNIAEEER